MTKQTVIDLALTEVGYLEKSAAAYKKNPQILYEKTAGAGYDNYTKYGYEMHKIYPSVMDFPAYWCDAFVDWCFYKSYGVATAKSLLAGNFDDYTVASAQMFKDKGGYHKGSTGIQAGDQIFFTNGTRINHTGLVVAVSGNTITTVEGNTSPQASSAAVVANGGGVFKKQYPIGYSRIDGYGRPAYEKYLAGEIVETYPKWIHENSKWYYRLSKTENAHGWHEVNHHWYYFRDNGEMVTGLYDIHSDEHGDEKYYFTESGDFEGALMKTDDRGALKIWDV